MKLLKKEWDDTEITPQVLLQTRNRAWHRLQDKRRRGRLLMTAGGALAALAALLFLWVSTSSGIPSPPPAQMVSAERPRAESAVRTPIEQAKPPAPAQISPVGTDLHLAAAGSPSGQPAKRRESGQTSKAAADQAALKPAQRASAGQKLDRLVMNFRLPQSGVRMIWIKQRTPPPTSGGTG